MKIDNIKHILKHVDKANIKLKNEAWEVVQYTKSQQVIYFNTDCFDIYEVGGLEDCYCLFYKNVVSIEVLCEDERYE